MTTISDFILQEAISFIYEKTLKNTIVIQK